MRRDLMATQLRASLAHCTSGNALTLQAQGSTLLSRIEEYTANDRFDELRIIDLGRKRRLARNCVAMRSLRIKSSKVSFP
jgi:hypothetical protein